MRQSCRSSSLVAKNRPRQRTKARYSRWLAAAATAAEERSSLARPPSRAYLPQTTLPTANSFQSEAGNSVRGGRRAVGCARLVVDPVGFVKSPRSSVDTKSSGKAWPSSLPPIRDGGGQGGMSQAKGSVGMNFASTPAAVSPNLALEPDQTAFPRRQFIRESPAQDTGPDVVIRLLKSGGAIGFLAVGNIFQAR